MKVLVIGAGLAGLSLAYQLHQHHIEVTIVEARSRIGGRILTIFPSNRPSVPLDLGSTWFWDEHKHIKKLLRELRLKHYSQATKGLAIFDNGRGKTPRQYTPASEPTKYRLVGGMQALIDKLQKKLPPDAIHLDTRVTELSADAEGIVISATQNNKTVYFDADYVVSTIPPQVASSSITYHPSLPIEVLQTLRTIPTWMGQTMKIFLVFDTPFWQKIGLSGTSTSELGIVNEFYDASPAGEPFGVLVGEIHPQSLGYNMFKEERRQAIVEQLKRMYGWRAHDIKAYEEINWAYEAYTSHDPTINHQVTDYSGYGHARLQDPVLNGRLFWGGSEVSQVSGGYMDGAVYRAKEIADIIKILVEE